MSPRLHLLVLVFLLVLPQLFAFSGGSGTAGDPYQIASIKDLWDVRTQLSAFHIQTADIDITVTNPASLTDWAANSSYSVGAVIEHPTDGYAYYCKKAHTSGSTFDIANWTKMWEAVKGWEPIGKDGSPFRGGYNGNGKKVLNIYINRKATTPSGAYFSDGEDNIGLFGLVQEGNSADAAIYNLGIINPVVSGRRATGSLVGKVLVSSAANYRVLISRCYAHADGGSATVSGLGATGGLVGANNSVRKKQVPMIRFCWAEVNVSSTHPTHSGINPADNGNPYNIKYGGIVGCNENGVTFDSHASGNISGGDRVGGLAGCTIDGAIIRCWAAANVNQGISSTAWEGGIGGITGRIDGKLPPGLGGFQSSGSVQNSYYDNGFSINSAGGPLLTIGSTSSDAMLNILSTYVNWDFVNTWVWDAVNPGYPYLSGNTPILYHYKTFSSGNWSNTRNWQRSLEKNVAPYSATTIYPGFTNSNSIIVDTDMTLDITRDLDQMTINAGKSLTTNSDTRMTIENGYGTDLENNGTLTMNGLMEVGQSAEFVNNGAIQLNGYLVNSGTITWGAGSSMTCSPTSILAFNAAEAQATGTGFPDEISNLEIDNSYGLTLTEPFTITGSLIMVKGSYSGSFYTDGYQAAATSFLEIGENDKLISDFSATSIASPDLYPEFVGREWSISGYIDDVEPANREKTLYFYWTAEDDQNFNWSTAEPAVFVGGSSTGITGKVGWGDPRSIEITYTFPDANKNAAKETFKIGINGGDTLPVELSSFNAQINSNNLVQLIWVTQSETNVMGFRIYRSEDESFANAQDMGILIPATNTSHMQSYVWVESQMLSQGDYYYWLESIDFGGENDIFGPIPIHIETGDSGIPSIPVITGISKAYPNPFNPCTNVIYGMEKDALVSLDIYNSRGQRVRELVNGKINAGWHALQWDGCDENGRSLPSGMYYLRMNTGSKSYGYKMTLMK